VHLLVAVEEALPVPDAPRQRDDLGGLGQPPLRGVGAVHGRLGGAERVGDHCRLPETARGLDGLFAQPRATLVGGIAA
jgi:hypothetical protein